MNVTEITDKGASLFYRALSFVVREEVRFIPASIIKCVEGGRPAIEGGGSEGLVLFANPDAFVLRVRPHRTKRPVKVAGPGGEEKNYWELVKTTERWPDGKRPPLTVRLKK